MHGGGQNPPVSISPVNTEEPVRSNFYVGAGDPNSGPRSCVAGALPTEHVLSLKLFISKIMAFITIFSFMYTVVSGSYVSPLPYRTPVLTPSVPLAGHLLPPVYSSFYFQVTYVIYIHRCG